MNTAIELTYNINVTLPSSSRRSAARSLHLSRLLEPNLNLFPTAIQNGHINLIIRCVIRLADERLSLDGIKSVCPLFVDRYGGIKLGRALVMAHSAFRRRTVTCFASRRVLLPLFLQEVSINLCRRLTTGITTLLTVCGWCVSPLLCSLSC